MLALPPIASALVWGTIFLVFPGHATERPRSPACDPILAETFVADPISTVGHGVAVNSEGSIVDLSPEYILATQRYLVKRLYQQADDEQRSKFRKKQQRLSDEKQCDDPDQIYINHALIAWLIKKVEPENGGTLASANVFLLNQYLTSTSIVTGQRSHRFRPNLPKEILEELKDEDPPPFTGTELGGTAYIDECRAAGVPTPPDWGSPQWQSQGGLTTNFLGGNAEVFTFQSASPRGFCFALPRSAGNIIGLLGIICQGNDTSKACFWDNQQNKVQFPIPKNESRLLTAFAGGADLEGGTGGVCSDCHAGENAFIVHPGTPLDRGSVIRPNDWHEPFVVPRWPINPGPTDLLDSIALDPAVDQSCLGCHYQSFAGRFPEASRELGGYCNAVLKNAISLTMPPGNPGDPRYRKHIDALLKACDRHKGELASDNSVLVGNAPAESFSPCFGTADCPVKKTVMFSLPEATEVLIKYDLGQSHGCCADHLVGALRILLDGAEVLTDRIPYINYGVEPISEFLEDFDYFFPSEVVRGRIRPTSQLDPLRVGPILTNYKEVSRFSLGSLLPGSHTVELWVGDAGWSSIFEIYR